MTPEGALAAEHSGGGQVAVRDRVRRKLDELELPHVAGPYAGLGFRFAIRMADPVLAGYLRHIFGPLATGEPGPTELYSVVDRGDRGKRRGKRFALYLGDVRVGSSSMPNGIVATLVWHVNRGVVARSGSSLLIHGAAASLGGRAVVLSAPPESGKSTLVAGLVRSGFDYLTDEIVALVPGTPRVPSFPRSLSLDAGSLALLGDVDLPERSRAASYRTQQAHVPPDRLGARVAADSEVAFVVLPRYEPGAPTVLAPVSRAEALMAMADQCFNFTAWGGRGLELLAEVLRGASCWRLTGGDLAGACEAVRGLFGEER